jgi:hypothetical protein
VAAAVVGVLVILPTETAYSGKVEEEELVA